MTVALWNEGGVKAAHVEKLSGPVTHWYKEPDGEPDDFPQVLEVDGIQEPNPVTIEASDYGQNWGTEGKHEEWYFHRWQWWENGKYDWKMDEPRDTLDVNVYKDMTREAVYLRENGDIYDGQNGSMVPEAEEVTRGAFTVANFNDTDNDGIVDTDDTFVPGEVDLIRLVISRLTKWDEMGTVAYYFASLGNS